MNYYFYIKFNKLREISVGDTMQYLLSLLDLLHYKHLIGYSDDDVTDGTVQLINKVQINNITT